MLNFLILNKFLFNSAKLHKNVEEATEQETFFLSF